jgi:hypothetical protein
MPVTILFKGDGMAWGQVRQLAAYIGLALRIDADAKTITFFRA